MGDLLNKISEIIYEDVPLNLNCPVCEHEIEIESIMDLKADEKQWKDMAIGIVEVVFNALYELDDYDISKL